MLNFPFNLNGSGPTAKSASEKVNKLCISEPFSWLDFFSSPHQSSYCKMFSFYQHCTNFLSLQRHQVNEKFHIKKKKTVTVLNSSYVLERKIRVKKYEKLTNSIT